MIMDDACSCHDGSLVRHGKMCAVAKQDVCGGKARPLLWQDTREPQRAAAAEGGRPPLWRRPKAASFVSCHNRGLVLSQQTSCLATAHIFSCRTRYPSRQERMSTIPNPQPDWRLREWTNQIQGSLPRQDFSGIHLISFEIGDWEIVIVKK